MELTTNYHNDQDKKDNILPLTTPQIIDKVECQYQWLMLNRYQYSPDDYNFRLSKIKDLLSALVKQSHQTDQNIVIRKPMTLNHRSPSPSPSC